MRLGWRPVIAAAVAIMIATAIGMGGRAQERTSRSNAEAQPSLDGPRARYGLASTKDAKEERYGVSYSDTLVAAQAAAPTKPMMVEDVFKNVQALKSIGVDDFLLTMGIMSAAVGSDCVGCHPSAGTDHVDWAFDTARKRTARRMVQMVTAINRDNFNGRQVVTCWTCHRGRDRPVTTMTLDVVYGPPTDESDDVLTQAQAMPSVDQVLDKYLHAIG